jgi:mannan endo-1,4-beta-mannosidase
MDAAKSVTATFTLPLTVTTVSPLAVGSVGGMYSLNLAATGGVSPYGWNVAVGALPAGMSMSTTGALTGTPTAAESFNFTVQVIDSIGGSATKALTFLINGALLPTLGTNGSFEQNLTGWLQLGTGAGVQYAIVTDAVPNGVNAVRVTNRSQISHAPGQNVFSSLLVNANGTPVTTRFWVKLDAPGMARCLINLTSSTSTSTVRLILAEQVVRTPNVWIEVTGTATLGWSGTLTAATLEFNIGQPAENVYPGFTLDDIRLQRDADADGLPDADESASDSNNPDRDNDGLPDDWESRYALAGLLDPNLPNANLDADTDGFSNHQEFWAATNPLDAASKPGVPSVIGTNANATAITKYLALLPSLADNRVVSGQHITGQLSLGGLAGEFTTNVQALFDQTGKWPGILSMQYEGAEPSIGPLQVSLVNPFATDWAAAGGLVLIKFQPFDPWTLDIASPSGGAHVDLVGLLNPAAGNPANFDANATSSALWLDWLDQIATGLDQLQQAGVVVLWRPLSEMNNSSHWHSRQPRDAWIALWRHMYDYFSNTRGLKNLIWVYECDGFAHGTVPADYYYPGDDVVDLMGHNFYDDDWVLPYDLNAIFRRYPKIYGFPQAGSQAVRDGTWDNMIMITGIRQRNPRASLFVTWSDFTTGGGTIFNARSMVSQTNETLLLNDPWVITREEIDW